MARGSRNARGRGRKKGGLTINWGEAELNNRLSRTGTYAFKVLKAEEGDNENIVMDFEVTSDKQNGKTVREYFSLQPQALWKLANLMTALGIEIPEDEADLDLEEFVDKEFVGVVDTHDYNDKTYYRITEYMSVEDGEDEVEAAPTKGSKAKDEEDEKPARGSKSSKKSKEPELLKRDDVEGMDRDELEALIEEHELDVDPADRKLRKDDKLLEAVLEALEEKELLEEAEEEPEEEKKPARGRRGAAKEEKASKRGKKDELPKMTAGEVEDMNEEELEDLIEKYGLDVELDSAKTLRKKAALVLDALEEKELLEE